MKTTPFLSSAVSVLAAFALLASFGVSAQTWVGGSGTWDNTTTANWNPATVPVNGSTVNLTKSSTEDLDIDYAATNLTGTGLYRLWIGNTGGGTTTLSLDGSDVLPSSEIYLNPGGVLSLSGGTLTTAGSPYLQGGRVVQTGGDVTSSVRPNINAGSEWVMTGGTGRHVGFWIGDGSPGTFSLHDGEVNADQILYIRSQGTFTQTGGSYSQNVNYILSSGTINISGGTNAARYIILETAGVLNQTGGNLTAPNGFEMRGPSTYNLSAGTATFGNTYIGYPTRGGAVVDHTGGSLTVGNLFIAWSDSPSPCVYRVHGGALTAGNTTIQPLGTLEGYGTITFTGWLDNRGRVIADGLGTEASLDLSMASSILNGTENTTDKGWFAVNQGKLVLRDIAVTGPTASYNWGEAAADTTIDLVNSARLTFSGHGAGTLSGALLAVDRTDVPTFAVAGLRRAELFSVHDFNLTGTTFTDFYLTIRYDDVAAAGFEDILQIFHYTGGAWVPLASTVDLTNKWVMASGIASMSLFGVGYAIPEPTSALLLGLAGLALLKRGRGGW